MALLVYCPGVLPWGVLSQCLRLLRIRTDPRELRDGATLGTREHVVSLMLSQISWVVTFAATYFMFQSVAGDEVSFGAVLTVAPLTTVARMFPFTVDGLGATEAVGILLYGRAGVAAGPAMVGQLLSRAAGSYLVGLLGLLALLAGRKAHSAQ